MSSYSYSSFLTSEKLKGIITSIYSDDYKVLLESSVTGYPRAKWDILVSNKFIVEFDGDQHYRDSMVIYRDHKKDKIAAECRLRVIRIPYFVQLTSQMFNFWFGRDDIVIE